MVNADLSKRLTFHYPRRIHRDKHYNLKENSTLLTQLRARQTEALGFN